MISGETTGLALADLSNVSVDTVTTDPNNAALFATLAGEGIYRSDDAGYSWQMVSVGPPDEVVKALTVHPINRTTLYASTIDKNNQGHLWFSEDDGTNWTVLPLELLPTDQNTNPVINVIEIEMNAPDSLYLGTEGYGMYRVQLNTGQAELIGDSSMQGLYVRDIDVSSNGRIYAVTTEGLMVVEGTTVRLVENIPDAPVSFTIDPTNPQRLYAGTVAYGLFVSDNGGQSWQSSNAGFGWQPGIILQISAVVVDEDKPQHLAVATAYGVGSQLVGDGIYESFNAG